MLLDFSWKAFEKTGNINAYIFFKEIEEKSNYLKDRITAEEEVAISN